jgi:hypothetical protein
MSKKEDLLVEVVKTLMGICCNDCAPRSKCEDCQVKKKFEEAMNSNETDNKEEKALESFTAARGNKIFAKRATNCRRWEISEEEGGDFESIQDAVRWIVGESIQ